MEWALSPIKSRHPHIKQESEDWCFLAFQDRNRLHWPIVALHLESAFHWRQKLLKLQKEGMLMGRMTACIRAATTRHIFPRRLTWNNLEAPYDFQKIRRIISQQCYSMELPWTALTLWLQEYASLSLPPPPLKCLASRNHNVLPTNINSYQSIWLNLIVLSLLSQRSID